MDARSQSCARSAFLRNRLLLCESSLVICGPKILFGSQRDRQNCDCSFQTCLFCLLCQANPRCHQRIS